MEDPTMETQNRNKGQTRDPETRRKREYFTYKELLIMNDETPPKEDEMPPHDASLRPEHHPPQDPQLQKASGLVENQDGNLWIGSWTGLHLFDRGRASHLSPSLLSKL